MNLIVPSVKKIVASWLFLCAFMVILMITIGGYTRLEGAGLSIVEWKPVTGILFPQDTSEWQREFTNYQQSPEYQKKNFSISLEEFKNIYFIEYFHRLIGRLTGVIFFVPFLYFLFTRQLAKADVKYLAFVLLLGGLQGFLGWYMVKSGLYDMPEVSQYRLTSHLLMAITIYSLLVWKGFEIYKGRGEIVDSKPPIIKDFYILSWIIILQIALGGFIAGLDGGLIYNSFPLMDGQVIPDGLFLLKPWYLNFFNNITMLQFLHRAIAIIIVVYILYLHIRSKLLKLNIKRYMQSFVFIVAMQFILGVMTLIKMVPTHLALLHQLFGIILFTNLLLILYNLTYTYATNIKQKANAKL